MLWRIVLALLLIWPVGANAIDLPGWLKGMPPEQFMNRWIEGPSVGSEFGYKLTQLDEFLRNGKTNIEYKKIDDSTWVLMVFPKQKTEKSAKTIGDGPALTMTFGPGRFDDTIQVKGMTVGRNEATPSYAEQTLGQWGLQIKK